MANRQYLPSEILHSIFENASPDCLLRLALTSKRFRDIATPILYHHVYFWQSGVAGFKYTALKYHQGPKLPASQKIRIYHLELFTRSIKNSDTLRSFIKYADFRWWSPQRRVLACLEILQSADIRYLHLSLPDFSFELPSKLAVHSLAYENVKFPRYIDELHQTDYFKMIDRLLVVMSIPSLDRLYLSRWSDWVITIVDGRRFPFEPHDGLSRDGSSNIQHLTINAQGPPGPVFEAVLRWPKALKSLRYEFDEGFPFEDDLLKHAPNSRFQSALDVRHNGLQNLEFYPSKVINQISMWHNAIIVIAR